MREFEEKLKEYLVINNIDARQLIFEETCHSVEDAVRAVKASPEEFVKNICMFDGNGNLIVAIVKGEDRASTSRVAKALGVESIRTASTEEILDKTGYICGGVPSFGYDAKFLIDPKVMEKEFVYTGGGSPYSLTRISTELLQQINKGEIIRIRK